MSDDVPGQHHGIGLIDLPKSGYQLSPENVFTRYAERIVRLAERSISHKLRRRFDAEDIMQSAFGSFFRCAANGNYHFDHSGALWSLLVTITENKISRRAHNINREDVIDPQQLAEIIEDSDGTSEDKVAERLSDAVEVVLEGLNDRDAEFFRLKYRMDLSTVEISKKTDWSVATINRSLRRSIDRIRQSLERD